MDERNPTGAATGRTTAAPPGMTGARADEFHVEVGSPPAAGHGDSPERLAKQGAEEVGRQAREVKDQAKQAVGDAAGQAKQATQQAVEGARQQAMDVARQLRERGASMIDQQRTRAADLLGDCVAATRRAAQKLHDEQDHNLAGYADTAAEKLDQVGNYLRQTDARRLIDDVADAARRRPEWILGGAFVLGLAVSRFLKASREDGAAYGSYRHAASGSTGYHPGGSSVPAVPLPSRWREIQGDASRMADSDVAGDDFSRRPILPQNETTTPPAITAGAREFAQAVGAGGTTASAASAYPLTAQAPPPPAPEIAGDAPPAVRAVGPVAGPSGLTTLDIGEGRVREQPTVPTTTRVGSASDPSKLGDVPEVH